MTGSKQHKWFVALGLLCCAVLSTSALWAHPMDNALLTIVEESPQRFVVDFSAGSAALQRDVKEPAQFPRQCQVRGRELHCGQLGLSGQLEFPWLKGSLTRLIVDVRWLDGTRLVRLVSVKQPRVQLYGRAESRLFTFVPVMRDYSWLGVEHILLGWDHLCFVVGLTLLITSRRRLIGSITAFTAAHSLTLACAALGLWSIALPPVEALIALSIVLLCVECLRPQDSLTKRAPWLVAFGFGLIHGFGFASALAEVGLPEQHVLLALLCFNLGVEMGQLLVIALSLLVGWCIHRLPSGIPALRTALIYAMGSVGAAWSIERIVGIFTP
jgi:hydrogenase/urease accessory protein HupE